MKFEQLPNSTLDIERQRKDKLNEWKEGAKNKNKTRSLVEKLTGRNKVSTEDVMRDEADRDNVYFDRKYFRDGSMEDFVMPDGGRDLELYEKELMFDRSELAGKKVLDLGAGPKVKLAKALSDQGITNDVVSFSPDFRYSKFANQARAAMPEAKLAIGVGQKMQFDNESFDIVLSLHVCEHLNRERFLETILEIARILKPGGKAIVGPTTNEYYIPDKDACQPFEAIINNQQIKNKLDEINIEVEKVMIPESIVKPRRLRNEYGMKYYEPGFNIVLRKKNRNNE